MSATLEEPLIIAATIVVVRATVGALASMCPAATAPKRWLGCADVPAGTF